MGSVRILVAILLLVGAHFSLTANVPAENGRAWLAWPFAADTRPALKILPEEAARPLTSLLSVVAGACFVGAAMSLFGLMVPASWWRPLVVTAAVSSALLYLLYIGPLALLPLVIDALLLWGVLVWGWTVAGLRGS